MKQRKDICLPNVFWDYNKYLDAGYPKYSQKGLSSKDDLQATTYPTIQYLIMCVLFIGQLENFYN